MQWKYFSQPMIAYDRTYAVCLQDAFNGRIIKKKGEDKIINKVALLLQFRRSIDLLA